MLQIIMAYCHFNQENVKNVLVEVSLMTNRKKNFDFWVKSLILSRAFKICRTFRLSVPLSLSIFATSRISVSRNQIVSNSAQLQHWAFDFCAIIERFLYMFFHVSSRTIYIDKGDSLQEAIYTTLSLVDHNHYTLLVETCLIILIYGRWS